MNRRAVPDRTGDWPYIGVDYGEACISGKKIKIMFVAMDRGEGEEYSEEQRFEDYQRVWRENVINPSNPHMCGAHLIMKELVREDTKDPSKFANQFALTNSVKCGHMWSSSTPQMRSNCSNHLLEEIRCLEPNLIITQGSDPAWWVTYRLGLNSPSIHSFPGGKLKAIEIFESEERLVLTTPYPAARQVICSLPSLFEAIQKVKDRHPFSIKLPNMGNTCKKTVIL
ncbi:MAG: hypothetical protein C4291_04180 [Candidatus Dadabacteria bacterium]